ncbi:hypothetical protein [Cupriavidus sp. AU9028]|nr:hypothetical protein [Cupriavidus sp. AU9028]MBY4897340.1 hypothetical protein [Cupriavidus sp. AU9028]
MQPTFDPQQPQHRTGRPRLQAALRRLQRSRRRVSAVLAGSLASVGAVY